MKIVVAAAFHNYTGPAITAITEAIWLKTMGVDVKMAISQKPKGNLAERAKSAGLQILNVNLYRKRFNPVDSLSDIKMLSSRLQEFDAVISHHSNDHWIFSLARGKRRAPIIVREIHRSDELKRPFTKSIFKKTDGFIVVGESFGKTLTDRFSVNPDKILAAPLSVDTKKFRPDLDGSTYKKQFNIPVQSPVIGLVSRIKENRGHELCVKAAKIVENRVPNVRWAFIGRGELQKQIENLIMQMGLKEKITIWGFVGDKLPAAICACDLMLLLSEPSDGGCRAAIEAAACGKPTLAPKVGTLFDVLEPEKEAFILNKPDPTLLAKRVEELIPNNNLLKSAGAYARTKVEMNCTEPNRTEKIVDFIKRLTS